MKTRLTNKLNLPGPIVKAVANDTYNAGRSDYTVTGLLQPPRLAQLLQTADVEEDAADRLYAMQGQIMHGILERAGTELEAEGYIVEKRFYGTYQVDGKPYIISAQIDLFDPATATISDYKYTSVGSAKRGLKEEHRLQLNVQAELIRKEGFQVEAIEVVLLLRDWTAMRKFEGYPTSPVMKQSAPLMTSTEVTQWIEERIRLHEAAKVNLPQCSDEERWSRPTFAVMKDISSPKATRVFDTRPEAEAFITAKAPTSLIVERPGVSIRCLEYCPARSVCEQAQAFLPPSDADGFIKVGGK